MITFPAFLHFDSLFVVQKYKHQLSRYQGGGGEGAIPGKLTFTQSVVFWLS